MRLIKEPHGVTRVGISEPLTVLALSDLHFPYHHPDSFRFMKALRDEFTPDLVVCLGDEVDNAALSFHEKNPDMPSAKDEYESALECLGELYKIFPEVLVCNSNHTSRFYRVAHAAGLPSRIMKSYSELLQAPPGWSWHDRIIVNDVLYIHGDPACGAGATKKLMTENRMSVCHGHVHAWGGVQYSASPFQQIFGLNAGCLVDLEALAFKYGAKYNNKGTLGCGLVQGGKIGHFIPMV